MICQWCENDDGLFWCPHCDPRKRRLVPCREYRLCSGLIPPGEQTPCGNLEPPPPLPLPHGVGYHLKRVLAYFLLLGKAGCGCNAHAATMDRNGPDWCAANIDTIIGWMRAEAKKRKLPFMAACAEGMILLAIRNARRDLPV